MLFLVSNFPATTTGALHTFVSEIVTKLAFTIEIAKNNSNQPKEKLELNVKDAPWSPPNIRMTTTANRSKNVKRKTAIFTVSGGCHFKLRDQGVRAFWVWRRHVVIIKYQIRSDVATPYQHRKVLYRHHRPVRPPCYSSSWLVLPVWGVHLCIPAERGFFKWQIEWFWGLQVIIWWSYDDHMI
jgi:hypothetical protein